MKITPGEWKMRDGQKAIVAASNAVAHPLHYWIGWVDGDCTSWTESGRFIGDEEEYACDLVAPWIEPVPWDWSTTPPWMNCLIQGPSGQWYLCDEDVEAGNDGIIFGTSRSIPVPRDYSPEWAGDWRKSKTMRPGFNGGSK